MMGLLDPRPVVSNNVRVLEASKGSDFLHYNLQLILAPELKLLKPPLTEWNFLDGIILAVNVIGNVIYFAEGPTSQDFEFLKFNRIS